MICKIKKCLIFTAILFFSTLLFADNLTKFSIIESIREHDLNPQTTSYASDAQLLTGLYEGLFSYDPVNLNPTYAIATDYRISRDKKRWTFTICSDACYSNGEKITAKDVRDSWLRLLSTPGAPYASLLDVIVGAEAYRLGKCSQDDVAIYANSDESLSQELKEKYGENYKPYSFIYEQMPDVLAAADLILSRAGANSIWEAAVLYKPMLLIPLCGSGTRGDQVDNAKFFEEKGAALVLLGQDANSENLKKSLTKMLETDFRQAMKEKLCNISGGQKPSKQIAEYILNNIWRTE